MMNSIAFWRLAKSCSLWVLAMVGTFAAHAQVTDTLPPTPQRPSALKLDTLGITAPVVIDTATAIATSKSNFKPPRRPNLWQRVTDKKYPNPAKATVLSLLVPGAGQIYNKKYWKLPIVYGGLGAIVYALDFNAKGYKRFDTAYRERLTCNCDEFADKGVSLNTIQNFRDRYRKNKELSYIGFTLVYLLNAVDAFVDAHLNSFDVSDDLGLQWYSPDARQVGIAYQWHRKPTYQYISFP